MAKKNPKDFWQALGRFTPSTIVLIVMPLTLLVLHFPIVKFGITAGTLILLVMTLLYSLGSSPWVPIALSIESSLYLNYFLTPPFHSLRMSDADDISTLIIFLISSSFVALMFRVIVTKQSEIELLLDKMESLRNQRDVSGHAIFELGDWRIDMKSEIVESKTFKKSIHLTPIEWKILQTLITAEGALVSQKELLQQVWGDKYSSETNYLRLYLSQLRKKLEVDAKKPSLLITEPGRGYRAISRRLEI